MALAPRAILVAVSLVVLAWLVVLLRDARLVARAKTDLVVPGHFAQVDADLRHASLLNPDSVPRLYRSFLYQAHGQWRRAAALAEDVTRQEPDNPFAWSGLLAATRGHLPAEAARATARLHRLDPLDNPG